MSDIGANLGNEIKSVVKGVHGAGEAIRGNVNQFVDTIFNDKAAEAQDRAVTEKGLNEMESAHRTLGASHGTAGAGSHHAK